MTPIPEFPRRQRGFTLTELFAVVAVAAILAAVAIPNIAEFIKNNNRAARLNSLVSAFNLARSTAVATRQPITVCVSSNSNTCTAGDGNAFHVGFVARTPGGLLRVFQPEGGGYTLLGDEADGTDVAQVTFDTLGRAVALGTRVRFTYCDDRGPAQARAIVLSTLGQPRMSTDETGDNIHDVANVNLTCPP